MFPNPKIDCTDKESFEEMTLAPIAAVTPERDGSA